MRPLALLLVAAALVAAFGSVGNAAPVPKHLAKEPEADKAKLQGKWKVEAMKVGGQDALALIGQNVDMTVEIKDDAFTATANIGGKVQTSTAKLVFGAAGAKQVRMTEMRATDGNGNPVNAGKAEEAFGYAFDGDKLLMAATPGVGDKKVAPDPLKPGPNDVVMTLTRVK